MLEEFIKSLSVEQKQALLQSISESLNDQPPIEKKKPKPVKTTKSAQRDTDLDFTVSRKDSEERTRMPVTERERFNSFIDDGSEAKGEEFSTPDTPPTERRRPPAKKVTQTCSRCGKTFEVHPTHARERFVCDKCIGAN